MLEKIKYINHMNEVIEFGANGLYVNESDLHDFAWSITKKNDRISAITTGVVKKSIPVVIMCGSEAEGIAKRNALLEICEKDVLTMNHGRFVIGDYYLKCFVTGNKYKGYMDSERYAQLTLTVQTDYPKWIKETITTFGYGAGKAGKNLDFNNDFPYDYSSNLLSQELLNTDFIPTNFRMNIHGACVNPRVTIAGHDYEVAASLEANEFLTIDSVNKTVILTHTDGTVQNCFNLRNRDSYIFEKIPVGVNTVSNSGDFKFDITLLEERSAPKWT